MCQNCRGINVALSKLGSFERPPTRDIPSNYQLPTYCTPNGHNSKHVQLLALSISEIGQSIYSWHTKRVLMSMTST